jgi:hypothetical protein
MPGRIRHVLPDAVMQVRNRVDAGRTTVNGVDAARDADSGSARVLNGCTIFELADGLTASERAYWDAVAAG